MTYTKVKPYEKLSLVYDHLMKHVNYELWAEYIFKISKPYLSTNPNILDLAGGNAHFAEIFRKYYRNILVTDKSFEMLSYGESKLQKVCCEMSFIPFKNKFDLIYSTFDSINYLTSKKNVLKVFKEVSRILSENGIFTFDVSLEKNSLKYVRTPTHEGERRNVKYNHLSLYNKKMRIHKNIFEIESDGNIYKEVHKQKIYPFEVYFDLLEKAKLFVVACYESFTFKMAKASSQRAQFITKRIQDAVI